MKPDLLVNSTRRDLVAAALRRAAERSTTSAESAEIPLSNADGGIPALQSSVAPFVSNTGRTLHDVDVVISCNEVNDRHGTGVLIQRMFANPFDVISIRAQSHYNGEQSWGRIQATPPEENLDRSSLARWVLQLTASYSVRRIFCVPFGESELHLALALRDATGAPLCLYVMDDQNAYGGVISDTLMAEAVEKSTVRLAISSDMRDTYELKYARRFWIAPPTILHRQPATPVTPTPGTAVMIGNIWGRSWLKELRDTVRSSGVKVTWFANNPGAAWLGEEVDGLERDGIEIVAPLPESELMHRLGGFEFAILPSAPVMEGAENASVAALSLPSRVPYLLGASSLPIAVLGDLRSCAARFVRYFGVGAAIPYQASALHDFMSMIRSSDWRTGQATCLASVRAALDCPDVAGWFRATLDSGRPATNQFESLQVLPKLLVNQHLDETPRLGPWLHHMNQLRSGLDRIRSEGFVPSFIVDVGASNGIWSAIVSEVFPNAHYVQVEPLRSRYDANSIAQYEAKLGRLDVIVAAVGSSPSTAVLHVDEHLYGASLLEAGASSKGSLERVEVKVRTLDDIASALRLHGEGIVKLDIQGAELEALRGARNLVAKNVVALILEITVDVQDESLPNFLAVANHLDELGFVYYDDAGEWRDPTSGVLLQKDVIFVKKDHMLATKRRARN
jgi:FkbM family methyltransferase